MIAIIGATGTIGSELLKRLADLGVPARALSREPEMLRNRLGDADKSTIEVAGADAADPESLRRAFAGVKQLFLTISNSPRQAEMEMTIIRLAAEAGIEHIVKISSPAFEELSPVAVAGWHRDIESFLSESGMTSTVLRPYAFMQNLLRHVPTITAQGAFFGVMGDAPCNFIDCRDIADVAAEILTNQEAAGRIYTLTGSEIYSYPQIADKLSALLGKTIRYINVEPQVMLRNLTDQGRMPPWLANHVVEIQTMSTLVPERPTDDVTRLLGRQPRTLDGFLQENVEIFR
ncbi:SDR family oxidoreductase [Paenibacillus sp. FSL K6-3182]|uniref:SDR family oxidoreductase n=1 Tax=Paenibacillus sp. FSL K6-3182 TaxID=2921495 RepID=UPI0030CC0687